MRINCRIKQSLTGYMILFMLMAISGIFIPWQSAGATDKPLYLDTSGNLSRTVYAGTARDIINEGATRDWVLAPVLATNLTVDGGTTTTIPVTLTLDENGSGVLRSYTISLISSGTGGLGTIASLPMFVDIDLNPAINPTYNLNITYTPGADFTLPAGSTLTLRIQNNSSGSGNRQVRVYANGSFVNLPSDTIINVDSVEFHDAAYNAVSVITTALTGSSSVYIRAIVSDPFGSYDITSAAVTLLDPSSTPVVSSAAMTEVNDSGAATKTYEYTYTPVTGPEGIWTAQVVANEGTENTVTHTNSATLTVSNYITVLKSSAVISDPFNLGVNPKRIPGATVRYTLTVSNTRATGATNVVVVDAMPANTTYVANSINVGGTAQTDADDSPTDEANFNVTNANAVTVNVGALASGANETITFDVTIN